MDIVFGCTAGQCHCALSKSVFFIPSGPAMRSANKVSKRLPLIFSSSAPAICRPRHYHNERLFPEVPLWGGLRGKFGVSDHQTTSQIGHSAYFKIFEVTYCYKKDID